MDKFSQSGLRKDYDGAMSRAETYILNGNYGRALIMALGAVSDAQQIGSKQLLRDAIKLVEMISALGEAEFNIIAEARNLDVTQDNIALMISEHSPSMVSFRDAMEMKKRDYSTVPVVSDEIKGLPVYQPRPRNLEEVVEINISIPKIELPQIQYPRIGIQIEQPNIKPHRIEFKGVEPYKGIEYKSIEYPPRKTN